MSELMRRNPLKVQQVLLVLLGPAAVELDVAQVEAAADNLGIRLNAEIIPANGVSRATPREYKRVPSMSFRTAALLHCPNARSTAVLNDDVHSGSFEKP